MLDMDDTIEFEDIMNLEAGSFGGKARHNGSRSL